MLVGIDSEWSFRQGREIGDAFHGDVSTFLPVCACLFFEDGREIRATDRWEDLRPILEDPRYTFVVHGCHAESLFCEQVGLPFPVKFLDTLLMSVVLLHVKSYDLGESAFFHAGLGRMAARYGIFHPSADGKDAIRQSIIRGTYLRDFGMPRVLDYCCDDARAGLQLVGPLREELRLSCGRDAEKHLVELYQPYALVMAATARKGLRFDLEVWNRAVELAPRYRERLLNQMRDAGYDHDGEGLGQCGFARMITNLGLARTWPRTPSGMFSTRRDDLKVLRRFPAIDATYKLDKFDTFMAQDVGSRVDSDGRLRCGILPLAQRTSRTSTVKPNLMGMPAELRPLLLPDDGCKFVHFDFSQQEPGIAGFLSGDDALLKDFAGDDVYRNLGWRMGLLTPEMTAEKVATIRNSVLKALMLSIIYDKSAFGIARDLPCSLLEAKLHLLQFARTYPRLCAWLRNYVVTGMQQGWAENIIGYRAAFNVIDPRRRRHIARSCQNFPIQSSAAACFQLTVVHLGDFGADIRLPLHDGALINVVDEPRALLSAREQIEAATASSTNQLFPGLAVRVAIEELDRFAKARDEDSLRSWLQSLEESC